VVFKQLARRIAFGFVVLLGVTAIVFFIARILPGDPAVLLAGEGANREAVERIRAELRLDDPVPLQYVRYLGGLLRGDLGRSTITGQPVWGDIAARFPATAQLAVSSVLLALVIALPLAMIGGISRNVRLSSAIRVIATLFTAVPAFWLGMLLIAIFYHALDLLPASGRADAALADGSQSFLDLLRHLVMPATALAIPLSGLYIRTLRAALIRIRNEDYLSAALAFGVTPWRLWLYYYLRNAIFSLLTVLGLSLGALMTGSVVVESIFGWPGVGLYMLQAINNLDAPAIMGVTVVICVIYVLLNACIDASQDFLDASSRSAR